MDLFNETAEERSLLEKKKKKTPFKIRILPLRSIYNSLLMYSFTFIIGIVVTRVSYVSLPIARK